ncbi:MAG: hypothetical protein ACYTEQ_00770 [Planctomycetota bacterium]|jgi:hypothetical protein
MEGQDSQQSPEQTPTLEDAIAEAITSGPANEYDAQADDAPAPDSEVAPTAEHPDGASQTASDDGTPTDGTGEAANQTDQAADDKQEVVDPAKAEDATPTAEDAEAAAKAEADKVINARRQAQLGTTLDAASDPAVLQKRYNDQREHVRQLTEARNALDATLAQSGVQLVNTRDGYKLAATDEAVAELPIRETINRALNSMDPADRAEKFADPDEAAKLVSSLTEQVVADLIPQRPQTSASAQDAVLSDAEAAQVWDDFVTLKDESGKAVFPDAEDALDEMKAISESPNLRELAAVADTNAAVLAGFQQLCYYIAKDERAIREAIIRDAKAISEQNKTEIKQEVTVSPAGAATKVAGQTEGSTGAPAPGAAMAQLIQDEMGGASAFD